jgi:hypothetical protein
VRLVTITLPLKSLTTTLPSIALLRVVDQRCSACRSGLHQ